MIRLSLNQGRRLLNAYRPIAREAWTRDRRSCLLVIFLSIASAFAQTLLIGVLIGGLKILDPKSEAHLFGLGEWFRSNRILTLTGLAIVYIGIGISAAWAEWKRELESRKMARRKVEKDTVELLESVARADVRPRKLPDPVVVNPNIGFIQGPLISSIALETLVGLIPHVVLIVVFTFGLVALDFKLLFVAIPFIALPLPALYLLNRLTHQASSRFYGDERRDATQQVVQLVNACNRGDDTDFKNAYESDEQIARANDDYDTFKLANQKSKYVSALYRSIGIGLGILGFGIAALMGVFSWVTILGSILALQRLQSAFSLGLGGITSLIRFLTVVENHQSMREVFSDRGGSMPSSSGEQPEERIHLFVGDIPFGKIGVSSLFEKVGNELGISTARLDRETGKGEDSRKEDRSQLRGVERKLDRLEEWASDGVCGDSLVMAGDVRLVNEARSRLGGNDLGNRLLVFVTRSWDSDETPDVDRIWLFQKGDLIESNPASEWVDLERLRTKKATEEEVDLTTIM